jgi:hypothetical protein
MVRTHIAVFACVALVVTSLPAQGGTDPAATCKSTKAKAAGGNAADALQAFGRNTKKPDAPRLSATLSKAASRLTKDFQKAESKGGCATTSDVAAIEAKVDAFVDDVVAMTSPTTTSTTTTTLASMCSSGDGYPVCNGICPPTEVCSSDRVSVQCICLTGTVGCNGDLDAGMCSIGACPVGMQCLQSLSGGCGCRFV